MGKWRYYFQDSIQGGTCTRWTIIHGKIGHQRIT